MMTMPPSVRFLIVAYGALLLASPRPSASMMDPLRMMVAGGRRQ